MHAWSYSDSTVKAKWLYPNSLSLHTRFSLLMSPPFPCTLHSRTADLSDSNRVVKEVESGLMEGLGPRPCISSFKSDS